MSRFLVISILVAFTLAGCTSGQSAVRIAEIERPAGASEAKLLENWLEESDLLLLGTDLELKEMGRAMMAGGSESRWSAKYLVKGDRGEAFVTFEGPAGTEKLVVQKMTTDYISYQTAE